MKGRRFVPPSLALLWAFAACPAFPAALAHPPQGTEAVTPEADGEHLRVDTDRGPLHLWRPANYDARMAGMVIYIHGYYTSVDQTWKDDNLAEQFRGSRRNALFIAIPAPQSNDEEVKWKSLSELLRTVEDVATFPLPQGPLVVVGHSGAFRTILQWLDDPQLQYVILLDGFYGGQEEFRAWLQPQPHAKPHRMVLVARDTWRESSRFAHHTYGSARRNHIPAKASSFATHETHARLLCIRSQYDHSEIVSGGRVIPVILQISPVKALGVPGPQRARRTHPHPPSAAR